ncbi:ATP-binding protein [Nonomuraea sp. FMUSA5-5]|uniref:ATP-binding protein n=1 Tax=Nonomuraea composti TaxID=2720023 RepID=A0ABX1B3E9_9ACTN|nr:ATP-binding protein [Nonomuraea sp. FMUSA5-5]
MTKPAEIFARDAEWAALTAFAERVGAGTQLGIVRGSRRQGKTFLTVSLARRTGGFHFCAAQATEKESLSLFSAALAEHTGVSAPTGFRNWETAIRRLFAIFAERRELIVLDDFPNLCKSSPALPSITRREIDRAVLGNAPVSLLLCGTPDMGRLLENDAPLRGRAVLELVLHPFAFRRAAEYWGMTDRRLAVRTHATVGGTPAYLPFAGGDGPDDFDDWVRRTVLNPAIPLFWEARWLLTEELPGPDRATYHSVLAAVAAGNGTKDTIAARVGGEVAGIGHCLRTLEDCRLLRRGPDVFRPSRSHYRIHEPLIAFYENIMRPHWGLLESGRARDVWTGSAATFDDRVLGPHFAKMCRQFAMSSSGEVGSGVVTDPVRREQIQIDVAVFAPAMPGERRRILSLGEAKWGKTMGSGHVARLRRARDVLDAKGYDVSDTVLTCYSGAGFDASLARERDVRAVGLGELYG